VEKTSVVTLVNNEFLKGEIQFKIIVWVTVARKSGVIELQNKIANAMNVNISEDDEYETLRAGMLSEILSENGRFVLILDDERVRFSLENVGIPESFGDPKSIVEHCVGLSLVIVIVASSMRGEDSIPIWRNALAELNRNISSTIDFKDKVYQQLIFSYNQLKNRRIQNCFFTCALYRENLGILKEQLIRNWVRKGLIKEMDSLEANMDNGQAMLRTLIENCLLENIGKERVKMHDLATNMVKFIIQELYES
ncbi:hypothetical protein Gohar_014099, partial [Gossypium harknessii]|nr:hypothetical protein [Gossypium harknessii]